MALDFPSSPALNDTYTDSGKTWRWNGSGWQLVASAPDNSISTTAIQDDAVTYAKLQNVSATDKLLGRSSAGAGNVEEITCTAAGRALLDDADAAAQRTTLGLGTLATQSGTFSGTSSGTNTGDQTITLTGDVTGSGTGSFAATIADGAVTAAKASVASQAQAEAGTDSTTLMTPQRTAQAIAALSGSFPSGTVMLFVQTAAPTGWTKSTTHNDKALRVVSGAAGSGGSSAFTTVFGSRTPEGSVGNTTLTTAQIPSHTHFVTSTGTQNAPPTTTNYLSQQFGAGTSGQNYDLRGTDTECNESLTSATGTGDSHNHSFTGTAMDFAVQYVDVIIATKD